MKPINLIFLGMLIFGTCILTSPLYAQVLFINIDVEPNDAVVHVDNQLHHPQKGPLELTKDKHILRIEKEGYFTIEEEIKVSKKSVYFNYELIKNPNEILNKKTEGFNGYLILKTDSKAFVVINDSFYENIDLIEFEKQTLDIFVWKEGSDTISKQIEIIEGDTILLEVYPNQLLNSANLNLEMVLVQGGAFMMGRNGNKEDARPHSVKLEDYYIGKYEVMQFQWEMVMGTNPSQIRGDSLPVENVTWLEVQIFIEKLNKISSKKYRLPSEAEWEYAARGGHKMSLESSKYSGGDKISELAWYWRNSGDSVLRVRFDNELMITNSCRTRNIGQLKPNRLGIFDMSGNVWEWCSDWYDPDYYLESRLQNPQGPEAGKARVCRGGGYISKARFCRNGFRFSFPPTKSYDYLGFRLVQDK